MIKIQRLVATTSTKAKKFGDMSRRLEPQKKIQGVSELRSTKRKIESLVKASVDTEKIQGRFELTSQLKKIQSLAETTFANDKNSETC